MLSSTDDYDTEHAERALRDVTSGFAAFRPPRRVSVSQGAAENLFFKQPGGIPGAWKAESTPYMIEPIDMLASRKHEAVVFAGPARTGKTAGLLLGWMAHAVVNDPGDMAFIQMTKDKAREFSMTDIDRAIRHSPNLAAMMGSSQHDNVYDKMFRHGMLLKIAWPTVSNVSGSTYRYVAITELDRMDNANNVDGEGPLFDLIRKRTQTFLSRGMCLVESSPGIEIADPNWIAATPHEAPPVTGILGIYNLSDRRRWYWRCPACNHWFEPKPGIGLFGLPSEDTLLEIVREANLEQLATEHNRVLCPHCQSPIGPRAKYDLNLGGRWLREGEMLTAKNELVGTPRESSYAGYWLGGIPAAYQSWRSIILKYLQGLLAYATAGDEQPLKATTNTDQGMPHMSMLLREAKRGANDPASRRDATLQRYVCPDWTRFVIATVDVQGGTNARFIVQVQAVGPHRQKAIIDRYAITESLREGVDASNKAPIDPAAYAEDWDQITERVLRSTYRTPIENLEMRVRMVVVDSGGEQGVTDRAYAWYRRLRKQNLHARVMLVKGVGRNQKAMFPFIKESLVGARNGQEQGDIPLYLINTNTLKDVVHAGLRRSNPGPGYIHLPEWFPQAGLDELNAEVRQADGTWMQVRKRNETFDLLVYCEAGCLRLGADRIKWDANDIDSVPQWARPIAMNSDRLTREDRRELHENTLIERVVDEVPLPASQPVVRKPKRRVVRSSYLT